MEDASKGISRPSNDEPEPQPQPVGDAVGGIVGTAAGAGLGAVAGPIGVIIGAAAGALGGWWAGHTVSDVLENFSDQTWRRTHQQQTGRDDFENVRDFYRFGHLAGSNPDYQGRTFEEVEPDLRRSWPRDAGNWEDARKYIERAYNRRER